MSRRRAVLLGLDGFDPGVVETLWREGDLPNLARLRDRGGASRIRTTTPAQTPVAWSTVATGRNPGVHGIFDFLTRDPATCLPDVALFRYEQRNAFLPPKVVNRRRGEPVWTLLNQAGIPTTVLRFPGTYGPDAVDGRMLAGVGVPDIRGGFGTSVVFVAEGTEGEAAGRGGSGSGEGTDVVALRRPEPGRWEGDLPGPRTGKGDRATLPVVLDRDGAGMRVSVGGREATLEAGRWSPWLPVKFRVGTLQSLRGQLRFFLVEGGDEPVLYTSPVHFAPDAPPFPISHPWDYAGELARELGPYHTLGMAEEHQGLSSGYLDEAAFLEQCRTVMAERRAMMLLELERSREGLVACVFDTPDRLQHMFWRFREPDHPANRLHGAGDRWRDTVAEHYRACDALVGEVMETLAPDDLLMVVSDHGFGSFHTQLNLNTLLHREGLLHLKDGRDPGPHAGDLLQGVDWDRTSAYALGLSGIYLNLEGREGNGIVASDEAPALRHRLARLLTGYRDEAAGATAVRWARPREEVYRGPEVEHAPDVLLGCAPGWRISPETAMGGVPGSVLAPNTRRWAGDHVVDPDAVPGILLANEAFSTDPPPRLEDLAPTLLHALGAPAPAEMEGRNLLP